MSEFEKAVTGLGEECGVFGAYDMDGHDVAASIYHGLFALQHRGQESCGIAVTDTAGKRKVLSRKGLGHVNDVFDEKSTFRTERKSGSRTCEIFYSRRNPCGKCPAACNQLRERNAGNRT